MTFNKCKILLNGDIFYGYAQETAMSWLREYYEKDYRGTYNFDSERHNVMGNICRLKSGTYKVNIFKKS